MNAAVILDSKHWQNTVNNNTMQSHIKVIVTTLLYELNVIIINSLTTSSEAVGHKKFNVTLLSTPKSCLYLSKRCDNSSM